MKYGLYYNILAQLIPVTSSIILVQKLNPVLHPTRIIIYSIVNIGEILDHSNVNDALVCKQLDKRNSPIYLHMYIKMNTWWFEKMKDLKL